MRDEGQLQLIESITVAVFIFTAIAVSALFRIPTAPSTFQEAELERLGSDALRVMTTKAPDNGSECYESPCPFASDLERFISLALGYEGPTDDGDEVVDSDPLTDFMNQSLPDGVRYVIYYSNGAESIQIAPLNRTPPALNVVAAHAPLAPNWTAFSSNLDDSVLLRIGEPTGFGTASSIRNPLNRTTNEFGYSFVTMFEDTVPTNTSLGTHKLCYGLTCGYFTVTPPGIFGAGSRILSGDRDNASNIKPLGGFYSRAKTIDSGGAFDVAHKFYVDSDNSGTVSEGDLRLSTVSKPAGSFVTAADVVGGETDTLYSFASSLVRLRGPGDAEGTLAEAGGLYLGPDDTPAGPDQRRLARVGVNAFGSVLGSGGTNETTTLNLTFPDATILWADLNNNGSIDVGEPMYVDLEGDGLADGDFHLSPNGSPTVRYYYDIRLVVWYGV